MNGKGRNNATRTHSTMREPTAEKTYHGTPRKKTVFVNVDAARLGVEADRVNGKTSRKGRHSTATSAVTLRGKTEV